MDRSALILSFKFLFIPRKPEWGLKRVLFFFSRDNLYNQAKPVNRKKCEAHEKSVNISSRSFTGSLTPLPKRLGEKQTKRTDNQNRDSGKEKNEDK